VGSAGALGYTTKRFYAKGYKGDWLAGRSKEQSDWGKVYSDRWNQPLGERVGAQVGNRADWRKVSMLMVGGEAWDKTSKKAKSQPERAKSGLPGYGKNGRGQTIRIF